MADKNISNSTSFCSEYDVMPNPSYDFFIRDLQTQSNQQGSGTINLIDTMTSDKFLDYNIASQDESLSTNNDYNEKYQNALHKLELARKELSENLVPESFNLKLNEAQNINETLKNFEKMRNNDHNDQDLKEVLNKIDSVKTDLVNLLGKSNNKFNDQKNEDQNEIQSNTKNYHKKYNSSLVSYVSVSSFPEADLHIFKNESENVLSSVKQVEKSEIDFSGKAISYPE